MIKRTANTKLFMQTKDSCFEMASHTKPNGKRKAEPGPKEACFEKDPAEALEDVKKYLEEAKEAINKSGKQESYTYVDLSGKKWTEEPGAYNDYMVRAMAHDMLGWKLKLASINKEVSEKLLSWMPKMTTFNTEICRMMDDVKGNRPLKPWMYKKALSFIEDIRDTSMLENMGEKSEEFNGYCFNWVKRLLYMDTLAFYLDQRRVISQTLLEASIKEYDADGNFVDGLSEEDENLVKILCDMRKILLKALIRLPLFEDEYMGVIDKLEYLENITDVIKEGKVQEFLYLVKCKEAAEEFEKEPIE